MCGRYNVFLEIRRCIHPVQSYAPTLFTIVPPHCPGDILDILSTGLILMQNKECKRNVSVLLELNRYLKYTIHGLDMQDLSTL